MCEKTKEVTFFSQEQDRKQPQIRRFEVTQGPEQHSPSRVWSLQRAKKYQSAQVGARAQAPKRTPNRFPALESCRARPFSQGCAMINTEPKNQTFEHHYQNYYSLKQPLMRLKVASSYNILQDILQMPALISKAHFVISAFKLVSACKQ